MLEQTVAKNKRLSKSLLVLLQPLRWRCAECAVHHEWNVREEQHPHICGANK